MDSPTLHTSSNYSRKHTDIRPSATDTATSIVRRQLRRQTAHLTNNSTTGNFPSTGASRQWLSASSGPSGRTDLFYDAHGARTKSLRSAPALERSFRNPRRVVIKQINQWGNFENFSFKFAKYLIIYHKFHLIYLELMKSMVIFA